MAPAGTHGGSSAVAVLAASILVSAFLPLAELHAEQSKRDPGATQLPALYQDVSPAVVGLSCLGFGDRGQPRQYYGTGTIIDPSGLVLTSSTVVPKDARSLRAYLKGGRALRARVILSHPDTKLVVLKLRADSATSFRYVKLGDSLAVKVGDPSLSLGNAFRSIEQDDQVSLSAGVVSGYFHLAEEHFESRYTGLAIETSAPINSGMDGGPLLDGNGRLVGLLCLNYSRNRWLGTAVPVHLLKPLLAPVKDWFSDRDQKFNAFAGLELEEVREEEIRVLRADVGGPAAAAGILAGMTIRGADRRPLPSLKAFRELFSEKRPGEVLELEILEGVKRRDARLVLLGKY